MGVIAALPLVMYDGFDLFVGWGNDVRTFLSTKLTAPNVAQDATPHGGLLRYDVAGGYMEYYDAVSSAWVRM